MEQQRDSESLSEYYLGVRGKGDIVTLDLREERRMDHTDLSLGYDRLWRVEYCSRPILSLAYLPSSLTLVPAHDYKGRRNTKTCLKLCPSARSNYEPWRGESIGAHLSEWAQRRLGMYLARNGVNSISKYSEKFGNWSGDGAKCHLFIISDSEFAKLKKNNLYGQSLCRRRVGWSLGVHLILATRRNLRASWMTRYGSNSRFKLYLKGAKRGG